MRLIKFFTRKYTLLEHALIAESVLKRNSSIVGIYYSYVVDISKNGLIDIYGKAEDIKRNRDWVILQCKKNKNFPLKMLKQGLFQTRELQDIPEKLQVNIKIMDDKETAKELFELKKKFFKYSGYIDFTHYLGQSGVELKGITLKKFSDFHELRKKTFTGFLSFFGRVCSQIAKKKKVASGNLDFLTFREIVLLLENKLTPKGAEKMQKERRKHYILILDGKKERVIVKNFERKEKKMRKYIIEEKFRGEIKGMSIVKKGKVSGQVKIISQKTDLEVIEKGKVIVSQMTHPDMAPVLRKASAVITDEGGVLCHAAIISRELGIPCIIGTKIATKVLRDGDLVEVDANKGVVRILKRK